MSMNKLSKKQHLFINLAISKSKQLSVLNETSHCRSNQRCNLQLYLPFAEEDTQVEIKTDHDKVYLKNNTTSVKILSNGNRYAIFPNLRFIGKSGRGRKIDLFIYIRSKNLDTCVKYPNAIKVTVDGIRKPRNNNSSKKGVKSRKDSVSESVSSVSSLSSNSGTSSIFMDSMSSERCNENWSPSLSLSSSTSSSPCLQTDPQFSINSSLNRESLFNYYKQYAINCLENNLAYLNVNYINNNDIINLVDSISSFISLKLVYPQYYS